MTDCHTYTIRPARPDDLAALPAIERAAASLFHATPFAFVADFALASEAIDLAHDHVWVAATSDDQPVGFAIAHPLDGCAYLHELDVHPDHARRGLGRRLIGAVAAWGGQTGAAAVTLATFRDIPWNGPFYASLGFRPLPDADLSPGLRAIHQAEAAGGMPIDHRICMRLDLSVDPVVPD
jgi:GNAT superfamily N-acetyltransferase